MLHRFQKQLCRKLDLLLFLLSNPFSDNINCLSTLQSLQQIVHGLLIFGDVLLKPFGVTVVALLFTEVHHFFDNRIDNFLGEKIPESVDYH